MQFLFMSTGILIGLWALGRILEAGGRFWTTHRQQEALRHAIIIEPEPDAEGLALYAGAFDAGDARQLWGCWMGREVAELGAEAAIAEAERIIQQGRAGR